MADISPFFGFERANDVECDTLPVDGTVLWATPTGRTYKTSPAGHPFFPAPLPPAAAPLPDSPGRTLMMPKPHGSRAATTRPTHQ
ncbi:MAG TPA: hypothetical protein VFN75_07790 [Pseudonocardiaceae bacterium]|nr:hypothetical protein [Pseudonocardiaceae bacterium]